MVHYHRFVGVTSGPFIYNFSIPLSRCLHPAGFRAARLWPIVAAVACVRRRRFATGINSEKAQHVTNRDRKL